MALGMTSGSTRHRRAFLRGGSLAWRSALSLFIAIALIATLRLGAAQQAVPPL